MQENDLLQITHEQSMMGISLSNVYHYRVVNISTDPAPLLEDVAQAFITYVVAALLDVQTDELSSVRVVVRNLTNEAEYHEIPVSGSGALAGIPLIPRWTAYFRLNRDSALIRPGRKSFSGLSEQLVDGAVWSTTYSAERVALEGALTQNLGVGEDEILPIILRIEPAVLPSQYTWANVTGAQFMRWGTQNSRAR